MNIYTSNSRGNAKNCNYQYKKSIGSTDELLKAVLCDHIAASMKNNYRKTDNFIASDCVMLDLDNTHSESPEDWRSLDDISDAFPDVCFYYVHSRNYMKPKQRTNPKTKETVFLQAREKFHVYFPLSRRVDNYNEYEGIMLSAAGLFPYFDLGAAKPAQFFFGVMNPDGGYNSGAMCLDEYMAKLSAETIVQSVREFSEKVKQGVFEGGGDETRKAIARLYGYLKIDQDAAPEEIPASLDWIGDAEQKRSLAWLKGWAKNHGVFLGREYSIDSREHPKAIAVCVSCPWEYEHSEDGPENQSVIIIERGGKLGFLCRHSHGWKYGWKDFRAYYDKDQRVEIAIKQPEAAEKKGLILGRDGEALAILPNYAEILRTDYAGQIWLNALDCRIMIEKFPWDIKAHPVRDIDLYKILNIFVEDHNFKNKENAKMALSIVAYENAHHPVIELLETLKWDGRQRIADLFPRYLGAARSNYTTAVTKLLLYGAIQRVKQPGIKFDYCVILADTIQGTGKSSMCRFLALNDEWFSDSITDMGDCKKSYEAIRGHWIIELGEMLATRKTKSIEEIKAYITRQDDDYRDPYGVFPERRPRQCIFIGTSNKPQFLPDDPTGNRRFIPLICDGRKAERHPRTDETETREYIKQCYAEALQLGESEGWPLVLDPAYDDQLNAIREASTPDNPDLGILQKWLDECGKQFVCTRMIWEEVFKGDQKTNPTRFELQNISDLMNLKIIGWRKYASKNGKGKTSLMKFEKYGTQRAWERDPVNSPVNKVVNNPEDDGFITPAEDKNIPFLDEFSS